MDDVKAAGGGQADCCGNAGMADFHDTLLWNGITPGFNSRF
jgi:hypothetical protein